MVDAQMIHHIEVTRGSHPSTLSPVPGWWLQLLVFGVKMLSRVLTTSLPNINSQRPGANYTPLFLFLLIIIGDHRHYVL